MSEHPTIVQKTARFADLRHDVRLLPEMCAESRCGEGVRLPGSIRGKGTHGLPYGRCVGRKAYGRWAPWRGKSRSQDQSSSLSSSLANRT